MNRILYQLSYAAMCGQADIGTAESASSVYNGQSHLSRTFFKISVVFFAGLSYDIGKGDDSMKRLVTMQDLSCLGKCSLTVVQPTISAMGVACTVLPTAVFSTHTGFPGPAIRDLGDFARPAMDHWQSIGAGFDGILTGYLASPAQGELALELAERFGKNARIVHDPAMGDHGRLYSGMGPQMVEAHRRVCAKADLILPNLTEGAFLAGIGYQERSDLEYCRQIATALLKTSAKAVLLTGYAPKPDTVGFYYTDGATEFAHAAPKIPRACHGTGDLFAAVTTGGLLGGLSVPEAGTLAAEFVHRAIANTGKDSRFGVEFETELGWLAEKCRIRK